MSSTKISVSEALDASFMNCPVVTFATESLFDLDETFIQGKVVSYTVVRLDVSVIFIFEFNLKLLNILFVHLNISLSLHFFTFHNK